MKTTAFFLGLVIAALMVFQPVDGQNPLRKIKRESTKVINRSIDKAFEETEKEDQPAEEQQQEQTQQQQGEATGQQQGEAAGQQAGASGEEAKTELKWAQYDFVPGDRNIFEDILIGEETGEFPSRWDLSRGIVEVAEFGGENVESCSCLEGVSVP